MNPGTYTPKHSAMEYVLVIGDYYQAYDIIDEGSTGIAKVGMQRQEKS